jgi:hypothetical protein
MHGSMDIKNHKWGCRNFLISTALQIPCVYLTCVSILVPQYNYITVIFDIWYFYTVNIIHGNRGVEKAV